MKIYEKITLIHLRKQLENKDIEEFDNLTDKERIILTERFVYRKSLDYIGKEFNVTRERIRQIISLIAKKIYEESHRWENRV